MGSVSRVTWSIIRFGVTSDSPGMELAMNLVNMSNTPYKYPSLTGDMLFRLWRAAVKDDETLVEEMIRGMYEAMMAFDRERAEGAMDLTVRRSPTAGDTFRSLLKDMQTFRS